MSEVNSVKKNNRVRTSALQEVRVEKLFTAVLVN
jgi:hypothetical protein